MYSERRILTRGILSLVAIIGCASLLTSCASTGSFKEPGKDEPHAVLVFEPTVFGETSLNSPLKVIPKEINGLPPSQFGKWSYKTFRISPGRTVVYVYALASRTTAGYGYVEFVAEEGRTYTVDREVLERQVRIYVTNSEGDELSSEVADKQPRIASGTIPIIIPTG